MQTRNLGRVHNPQCRSGKSFLDAATLILGCAAIGAALGSVFGGPLGMAIGALVGAFVGTLAVATIIAFEVILHSDGSVSARYEMAR